jgi:hypothetical protein
MNKPASLVAAILFWLIALAQLLRVLFRVEVTAGGVNIPLWVSILAFIVLAALGSGCGGSAETSAGQIGIHSLDTSPCGTCHCQEAVCRAGKQGS